MEKIAEYSKVISENAKKYHQRQKGVGTIGYYNCFEKLNKKPEALY
jgi:hypothetical protein